jgi:4-diphosphocytidyl-2-C-methyl-D-erythritol kinase
VTGVRRVLAPAKLTVSLRVTGVRADGMHELRSEMVSIDLADELEITSGADGLEVEAHPGSRAEGLDPGPGNLVAAALRASGRRAAVRLLKRIPVAGGLGGGSSDAAAVLRWAGVTDPALAAALGADVPFCLEGGRAEVTGIGERVRPLPYVARSYLLLVPPFGVDTGAVYRAWDDRGGSADPTGPSPNDLTAAALEVAPALAAWGRRLAEVTGRVPVLAGSGSTWFVEGSPAGLGLSEPAGGRPSALTVAAETGLLFAVRTVPARWRGPGFGGVPGEGRARRE